MCSCEADVYVKSLPVASPPNVKASPALQYKVTDGHTVTAVVAANDEAPADLATYTPPLVTYKETKDAVAVAGAPVNLAANMYSPACAMVTTFDAIVAPKDGAVTTVAYNNVATLPFVNVVDDADTPNIPTGRP